MKVQLLAGELAELVKVQLSVTTSMPPRRARKRGVKGEARVEAVEDPKSDVEEVKGDVELPKSDVVEEESAVMETESSNGGGDEGGLVKAVIIDTLSWKDEKVSAVPEEKATVEKGEMEMDEVKEADGATNASDGVDGGEAGDVDAGLLVKDVDTVMAEAEAALASETTEVKEAEGEKPTEKADSEEAKEEASVEDEASVKEVEDVEEVEEVLSCLWCEEGVAVGDVAGYASHLASWHKVARNSQLLANLSLAQAQGNPARRHGSSR